MAHDKSGPSLEETLETKVDRRDFLKKAGMTVAAGGLLTAVAACGSDEDDTTTAAEAVEAVMSEGGPEIEWEMGTSWPLSLDTIYGGAADFGQRVSAMTGGRFNITPRAAGELVPGLEVLQNVQQNAIPARPYRVLLLRRPELGDRFQHGPAVRVHLPAAECVDVRRRGLAAHAGLLHRSLRRHQLPPPGTPVSRWVAGSTRRSIPRRTSRAAHADPRSGRPGDGEARVTVQVLPGGEFFQAPPDRPPSTQPSGWDLTTIRPWVSTTYPRTTTTPDGGSPAPSSTCSSRWRNGTNCPRSTR